MTGRKKRIVAVGLALLALIILLWRLCVTREEKAPVSNARFVMRQYVKEREMSNISHVELPVSDANGNAGTHLPEKEIYYREGKPAAQGNCADAGGSV